MAKFKYNGKPIFDIGLLLEQNNGADVDCNRIIHNGDIITTSDDRCIRIMRTNPNYEEIFEKKVVKKETKDNKKVKSKK